MNISHQGAACPASTETPILDDEEDNLMWGDEDTEPLEHFLGPTPKSAAPGVIVIVHSTGIFKHLIHYCKCPNAPTKHMQLFQDGLFGTTMLRPKTAFTFECLNMFTIDTLECKTSASNFYSKLRRLTNPAFLSVVPVSHSIFCMTSVPDNCTGPISRAA